MSWIDDTSTEQGRSDPLFYWYVYKSLEEDRLVLMKEQDNFQTNLDPLVRWEMANLDNDGSTDGLVRRLNMGENVFAGNCGFVGEAKEGAKITYGHLIQETERQPRDDMETWSSITFRTMATPQSA